jgi:AraC family transcriptional regulator
MDYLAKGKYYGVPQKVINLNGLIITDNEYVLDKVDWHYHENAYFTYMLRGRLQETSRKSSYDCIPGSLLFHNSQESHYNIKYPGYARGFQVEIENPWLTLHDVNLSQHEGVTYIDNVLVRNLFNRLYAESKISDSCTTLAIESLTLDVFRRISHIGNISKKKIPVWLDKVCGILNDSFAETISLTQLSTETGIHPVHISSEFPKYLNCTIGEYIRQRKAEKAFDMLQDNNLTLTEISVICGFADQSHFIRVFKSIYGNTPSHFRKNIC